LDSELERLSLADTVLMIVIYWPLCFSVEPGMYGLNEVSLCLCTNLKHIGAVATLDFRDATGL
jgi:hypothetical protein